MLISAKELKRYSLQALDGELGHVTDLFVDDLQWRVRYLIADTRKWLPGRKVLIAPESAGTPDPELHSVPVRLTTEQVRNSPEVNTESAITRQIESELAKYFGWTGWWGAPPLIPVGPTLAGPPPPLPEIPETVSPASGWPSLRRLDDLLGFGAEGGDGEAGKIEDFIVDGEVWAMRELVIETGNFWSGRKVRIDTDKIRFVIWQEKKFLLDTDHGNLGTPDQL
jgi:hypothetical protein